MPEVTRQQAAFVLASLADKAGYMTNTVMPSSDDGVFDVWIGTERFHVTVSQ